MSWPVPKLSAIKRPEPFPLRVWLPVSLTFAAASAALVLRSWPAGKATRDILFWGELVGVPIIVACLVLGWKLVPWQREQLLAEEAEREHARIKLLWSTWSRRHLVIRHVATFLPVKESAIELGRTGTELPVNLQRAVGFAWLKPDTDESRFMRILYLIADRLRPALEGLSAVHVVLLLDTFESTAVDLWTADAAKVFTSAMPGIDISVEAAKAAGCAEWITEQVDTIDGIARLMVAIQLWDAGDAPGNFSEGAVGILIEPSAHAKKPVRQGAPEAGSILRPMITGSDMLNEALAQLVAVQLEGNRLTHLWFSGCGEESAVITSTLHQLAPDQRVDRQLDHMIGLPGPVSGWIALGTALEAATEAAGSHLVAWKERDNETIQLCVVTGTPAHESGKEA